MQFLERYIGRLHRMLVRTVGRFEHIEECGRGGVCSLKSFRLAQDRDWRVTGPKAHETEKSARSANRAIDVSKAFEWIGFVKIETQLL
jgi:hypothetical protein